MSNIKLYFRGLGGSKIFPITKDDKAIDEVQGQHTNCLTSRYEGGQATGTYIVEDQQHAQEITPMCIDTKQQGNPRWTKIAPTLQASCYKEVPKVAGCLTGGGHSGGLHSDMTTVETNNRIRRLTPIECERLQGFPDNFTEGISNTQRYKCIGNAVTVNVIEFIAKRIFKMMEQSW